MVGSSLQICRPSHRGGDIALGWRRSEFVDTDRKFWIMARLKSSGRDRTVAKQRREEQSVI